MKRKNNKTISLFIFLGLAFNVSLWAESITGKVIDKYGNPIIGVIVRNLNNPSIQSASDKKGTFVMTAEIGDRLEIESPDFSKTIIVAKLDNIVKLNRGNVAVQLGDGIVQTRDEATASTSQINAEEIMKTSCFDLQSALYGKGLGLTVLQNAGFPWSLTPDMYVRGVKTITSSGPLVLIDGFERPMSSIVREEVETVTLLKDAASLAIYGLRGANGVILVTTKQGIYNTSQVSFSYDKGIANTRDIMKMVDGPTYAKGLNEALGLDGLAPRYKDAEIAAYESGLYPNYYPNVNWVDEAFGNKATSNMYNVSIRGGGQRVRYATILNLQNYTGLLKPTNINEAFSSQLKYSKLNLRSNLNIDITNTTKLDIKLLGALLEYNRPGISETEFIPLIYNTPSSAMPLSTSTGEWGGSDIWKRNPIAEITARGYGKSNSRTLFADWTLKQDLAVFTPGLSAALSTSIDSYAQFWEQMAQTYRYERNTMSFDAAGLPLETSKKAVISGQNTVPAFSSNLSVEWRHINVFGKINYNRVFGNNKIDANLMMLHDTYSANGQHNTYNRDRVSAYLHYGYKDKYFADASFSAGASNRLQPEHKFGYFPAVSGAWLISKEDFLKDQKVISLMKIRASWGLSGSDYVPEPNIWQQTFGSGGGYYLTSTNTSKSGLTEKRLATQVVKPETSAMTNIGLETRFFDKLDFTVEGFYQKRYNILCTTDGSTSSILGASSPYESQGIVTSKGIEVGLVLEDYVGDLKYTVGGNFTYYKNKIVNSNEVFREYDYLKRTGQAVNQIFGYQAIGYFKDQADITASPTQMLSEVRPGDIKFKDQNDDGKINSLDVVPMGYNTSCPEIYFSAYFNLEYKGIGIDAMFQGVTNYSTVLNTTSLFWGMRNNTNISQYVYDNRWTPDNQDSKFPRLTTLENANNYNTNSVWLADASYIKLRTCEVYYKLPNSIFGNTGLRNAKIYVRGIDLLRFDYLKIADTENYAKSGSGAYPATSSINMGMSVNF